MEERPQTSIPGFLTKTYEIFTSPEYRYCCDWGQDGKTIVVNKIEEFSKQVLPKYFKHSNFQSFVRQLNMYDFHKLVQDPGNGEFAHEHFLRDHPEKLGLIRRKANNRPVDISNKKNTNITSETLGSRFGMQPGDFEREADEVVNELVEQKKLTNNFERRLRNSEAQLSKLPELEERQSYLEGENNYLRQLVMDSRLKQKHMQDKMERVLKLLYSAYVSSGGSIGAPQKQALIDNGLGGLLTIEDGGSHAKGEEPPSIQALLGFKADDPNSPVVYTGDHTSASDPAGIDFANNLGISYLKSPSLDHSLVRLNSLRSDDIDLSLSFDNIENSNKRPPVHSTQGPNSLRSKGLDEYQYLANEINIEAASSSTSTSQPNGIAMDIGHINQKRNDSHNSSTSYQGESLRRIQTIDADTTSPSIEYDKNAPKRRKIEELSPLEQQEYDLLKRNQNTTLTKIDSLDTTICNVLDFIDDLDNTNTIDSSQLTVIGD